MYRLWAGTKNIVKMRSDWTTLIHIKATLSRPSDLIYFWHVTYLLFLPLNAACGYRLGQSRYFFETD
jgi:hypothetical protein